MLTAIVCIDCRTTDLTPPERLTIESNSIQRLFTEKSHTTVIDPSRSLKRAFLSNRTVTCNDGSQAGFYLRKSLKSKRWVVFFEGGWHCYDTKSCRTRWLRLRHLMTSAQWPETRDGKCNVDKKCSDLYDKIESMINWIGFHWIFFIFVICLFNNSWWHFIAN